MKRMSTDRFFKNSPKRLLQFYCKTVCVVRVSMEPKVATTWSWSLVG